MEEEKFPVLYCLLKKNRDEITVSDLVKLNHYLELVVNGPEDR